MLRKRAVEYAKGGVPRMAESLTETEGGNGNLSRQNRADIKLGNERGSYCPSGMSLLEGENAVTGLCQSGPMPIEILAMAFTARAKDEIDINHALD